MAITKLAVSYDTEVSALSESARGEGLGDKELNEVLWCFDSLQVWQSEFQPKYGQLKELRHRSNPDDPPDLEVVFERRTVGFEHTNLMPYPIGHAAAIAEQVNLGGGRILPVVSENWIRDELRGLAVGRGGKWAKTQAEEAVVIAELIGAAVRKLANITSNIVCIRDETVLSYPDVLAKHLFKAIREGVLHSLNGRTILLTRPPDVQWLLEPSRLLRSDRGVLSTVVAIPTPAP